MSRVIGKNIEVYVFLILALLAVYWNVWDFDFIRYDDPQYVFENPVVQGGLTWRGIIWSLTDISTGYWHPLTWISLMADYELYELNPGGYHLTNLLLHIINSILLFIILNSLTGVFWCSTFVAALFALHPLHVESVAWVAERKDVLSGLFWMLTLQAYVRYAYLPGIRNYLIMFLMFILGLAAKPMVVTLPFVMLLIDYWPLGRHRETLGTLVSGSISASTSWFRLILEKLPLILVAIGVSAGTWFSAHKVGAVMSSEVVALPVRIANALSSYLLYIIKMFWPINLAVYYPHPGMDSTTMFLGAGVIILIISIWILLLGKQYPYLPVGWLWYLGVLFPVSGIVVQPGTQAMADRYTYLPLIGIFIMITWGTYDFFVQRQSIRWIPKVAAPVILMMLMALAWNQVQYWQDSIRLLEHAVAVTTNNNSSTYYNLGNVYAMRNMFPKAMENYRRALRINPAYPDVYNSMGVLLFRQGDINAALERYAAALKINPTYTNAYFNMGVALTSHDRLDEALSCYAAALKIKPDFAAAHNNMGIIMVKKNRLAEAITHFRAALESNPWDQSAANNLRLASQARGE